MERRDGARQYFPRRNAEIDFPRMNLKVRGKGVESSPGRIARNSGYQRDSFGFAERKDESRERGGTVDVLKTI